MPDDISQTKSDVEGCAASTCSPFRFEIGRSYETQAGDIVKVLGRTETKGYECLICSDGKHRYDRSTGNGSDSGRVTGTAHDYSCPDNFKKENSINTPSPHLDIT